MDDLDELADAVWAGDDERPPAPRPHRVRMGCSPVLVLLLAVAGLLAMFRLVEGADPGLAARMGLDVAQLAGYGIGAAVLILVIAAGVRLGTGGRR